MKEKTKKRKSLAGKENILVVNLGDTVIIKNRSALASGISGAVMLLLTVVGILVMKGMWRSPIFWLLISAFIAGLAYSVAKAFLSKIVLDAKKMTMTVYNPFAKEYNFSDVNYVDTETVKDNSGENMFAVTVYIGKGKRSVEVSSYSKDQAKELERLMRAMFSFTGDESEQTNKRDDAAIIDQTSDGADKEPQNAKVCTLKKSTLFAYKVPKLIEKSEKKSSKIAEAMDRRNSTKLSGSIEESRLIKRQSEPEIKAEVKKPPEYATGAPELIKKEPVTEIKVEVKKPLEYATGAPEFIKREPVSETKAETKKQPTAGEDEPAFIKRQQAVETEEKASDIPKTTEPIVPESVVGGSPETEDVPMPENETAGGAEALDVEEASTEEQPKETEENE